MYFKLENRFCVLIPSLYNYKYSKNTCYYGLLTCYYGDKLAKVIDKTCKFLANF